MKLVLVAIISLFILTCGLPTETRSAVCPKINFSHGIEFNNEGEGVVHFRPTLKSADKNIRFVEFHMEVITRTGAAVGDAVSKRMQKSGVLFYYVLPDYIIEGLQTGRWQVKYSFTYSVEIDSAVTECNTPAYVATLDVTNEESVVPVQYFWEPSYNPCPEQCGFPASLQSPTLLCVGSDGVVYPHEKCKHLSLPQKISCPATAPCHNLIYGWGIQYGSCEKECIAAKKCFAPILDYVCVGSDGNQHHDDLCTGLSIPARACPATADNIEVKNIFELSDLEPLVNRLVGC